MSRWGVNSIRGQIVLLVVSVSTLAVVLASLAFVANGAMMARASKAKQIAAMAELLGFNSSAALMFREADVAADLLAALANEPTVRFACLFDADGDVFARYHRSESQVVHPPAEFDLGHEYSSDRLQVALPVLDHGEPIGVILIDASLEDLNRQIVANLISVAIAMVVALGVAFALTVRLEHVISRPVLDLAATTEAISSGGDYSIRVSTESTDEIGVLYRGFNQMLDRIQQSESRLREAHDEMERRVIDRTAELSDERRLLRTIIDSVPDGIIAADADGRFLSHNERAAEILGVDPEIEPTLDDWADQYELVEPDSSTPMPRDQMPLRCAIRGETVANRDFIVRRDDGIRVVSANATPMAADGRQAGVITFRDVTEQKHLEQQLSQAQKLESIGQLAAGLAHEINTPLQFVCDNINFLSSSMERIVELVDRCIELLEQEQPLDWDDRRAMIREFQSMSRFEFLRREIQPAIEDSNDGISRVVKIIKAMNEFTHPGSASKDDDSLNHVVGSTVSISRNRWKYVAEVDVELAEDLPACPMFTSEVNQMLLNLVINAADAITERFYPNGEQPEHVKGRITIRTWAEDDVVAVEVRDNGCGVSEENRKRVFDMFFTTKEVGKGTGQGLSIVHNVAVTLHGGSVSLDSEEGRGTSFTVRLPRIDPDGERSPESDAVVADAPAVT